MSYCTEVTDAGMEYISQLKDLSDLELRGLVQITSTGLTAVAAGCMRLAELDLKHCQKIKDPGFWALAFYSRNLRQVWLTTIKLEYEIFSNKMLLYLLHYNMKLQSEFFCKIKCRYSFYIIIRNYSQNSLS